MPSSPSLSSTPAEKVESRNIALHTSPVQHDLFYFHDCLVTFLVETRLFRVHRHFFERESEIFRDMFLCPSGGEEAEGNTDDNPIFLPEVTCDEFESFLNFFYYGMFNDSPSKLLVDWTAILSISTRFFFERVRERAICELDADPKVDPVQRLVLADKYDIPFWKTTAYEALCQRDDSLEVWEAEALGAKTTAMLGRAREKLMVPDMGARIVHNRHGLCYPRSPSPDYRYDPSDVSRIVQDVFVSEVTQETQGD